jgi:hypothetical protein
MPQTRYADVFWQAFRRYTWKRSRHLSSHPSAIPQRWRPIGLAAIKTATASFVCDAITEG